MRILILGGTLYLGRHLVDAARSRGHRVTLFNRGRTHPELFSDVERLRGDRDGDLATLEGRRWESVIDTSAYLPGQARATAEKLRDAVDHYAFVSSISVYSDHRKPGLVETDTVSRLAPGAPEELTGESYGALKVLCEEALESRLPGRVLVARAGLIVGAHDPTERSAYWPARVARGGEVLAPATPDRAIQLIDARDLSEWIVRMCETRVAGIFNATGPERPLTMGGLLECCREVANRDARFTWVNESFLLEREVEPFSQLPLWVPEEYRAFGSTDCTRALSAGFAFRPLADTVRHILDWDRTLPPGPRTPHTRLPMSAGLSPERERELLAQWRATQSSTVS